MKAIDKTSGMTIGNSIKHQLQALQVSIGCAPGWKALIPIIPSESTTPAHEKHPRFIDVLFFVSIFSITISYLIDCKKTQGYLVLETILLKRKAV